MNAQQIELNELVSEYMARMRHYAQNIAINSILSDIYKDSMERETISYFQSVETIHKEGAKYRYFKRFAAIFRLFLEENGFCYLEDIKARSHVIIIHSQDLAFYEEIS